MDSGPEAGGPPSEARTSRLGGSHTIILMLPHLAVSVASAPSPPLERAKALVQRMNATEQMSMLSGVWGLGWGPPNHPYVGNVPAITRLGVPWLSLQDGPQGYRDGRYGHYAGTPGTSTQWPSGLTVSATWDPLLAQEWGEAMGAEFKSKGANVQLGPGLNVARVPGGGRNFEYMSGEDPHLGAAMGAPTVRGIQSRGVIATAKHYVLNNQEEQRGNMSSDVDERTLRQIYLPPFAAAVEAGVGAIMCGYNRVNGAWACEDAETLRTLRSELNFSGWVMSDWGATHSTAAAANAGLDMEMPGGSFLTTDALRRAIANGSLAPAAVARMATRVLTSMYAAGVMDAAQQQPAGTPDANATSAAHDALAQRLATSAAVLLKNSGRLLPLRKTARVAVVGAAARCEEHTPSFGFGWPPSAGCLSSGGGSGGVVAPQVESILDAVASVGASVRYADGRDAAAAAAAAAAADVAVVVVGATSCEGTDRPSVELPADQLRYLRAVAAAQPSTVVVLMAPGAVAVGQWAAAVPAIACFFLPGQAQARAVVNVLYGLNGVSPSGRLPLTFPNVDNEVGFTSAQYPGLARPDGLHTSYSEGLAVGYRW